MSILLISRMNTDNLGDQAIHESMFKMVKKYNKQVFSRDLCFFYHNKDLKLINNKRKDKNSTIKKIISKIPGSKELLWYKKNKNLFNILKDNKFSNIIIGGGELIQGNKVFPIALYCWIKKIKNYQPNSKVTLYSVGATSNYDFLDKFFIKYVLNNVNNIYVRDITSKNNLKNIFNIDSELVADSVFINEIDKIERDRDIILYGLTNFSRIHKHNKIYDSLEDYYESTYNEIIKINEQNKTKKVKLFYTTKDDKLSCDNFNKYVNEKFNTIFDIADIDNLDDLKKILKISSIVYSPRMHGCILAKINGAKSKPIIISNKMKSYYERYENNDVDYNALRLNLIENMDKVIENDK